MKKSTTRRTFVKSAAAVSAAPMFVPASAFGANDKITMGCIGVGGMGRGNMNAFLGNSKVQIVSVCDVDKNNANKAKGMADKRYKNTDCKATGDYNEIIADKSIDSILCATPDHWHGLISIAAANAGKHIYCQKPMTHTFEEGRILADACKKNNVRFQVGSQQRSGFNFRWGVELVLNGFIGKVQHIEVGLPKGHANPPAPMPDAKVPDHIDYDYWCGPSEVVPYHPKRLHFQWRWHYNYGAGQLMDWIGHHNDIAHWGMDWDKTGPTEVTAVGFTYPEQKEVWNAAVNYEIKCKYEGGTTTSISNKNPMGTKWIGEDGKWVYVNRGKFTASNKEWTGNKFDRGPIKAYESRRQEDNFIDCIISGKECICPSETGHRSITPGHLGLVSQALGGKTLKWDPAKEVVTNDPKANELLKFNPRKEYALKTTA